jgi:hypothetical protein
MFRRELPQGPQRRFLDHLANRSPRSVQKRENSGKGRSRRRSAS